MRDALCRSFMPDQWICYSAEAGRSATVTRVGYITTVKEKTIDILRLEFRGGRDYEGQRWILTKTYLRNPSRAIIVTEESIPDWVRELLKNVND